MKLISLKDKYKGERAFIVGNGISLKGAQLNLIKNEYSFGVNRIGMIFPRTEWRPTFYFCSTVRAGIKEYGTDVKSAITQAEVAFLCDRIKKWIPKAYQNVIWFKCTHIGATYSNPQNDWWDHDISDRYVSIYGTSLFGVTRIAAYLGFKELYLLGCDLNYTARKQSQADPNHFSNKYEPGRYPITQKWLDKEIPRMLKSHEITYARAKKMDIKMFNATPGGAIEAYPRVNLKDVIDG